MARPTSADFICHGINSLINEEGSYLPALITAKKPRPSTISERGKAPPSTPVGMNAEKPHRDVSAISSASIVSIIHE